MSGLSQDAYFSHTPSLGCGLVRIGREWGVQTMKVPSERAALAFLSRAFELGIRIFDTAPSYGSSEERLGKFLRELAASDRKKCFVATKCGEEYDVQTGATAVLNSSEHIAKSIERSLGRLPHISLLQLHKATPALLRDESALNVLSRYKRKDIPHMGVCATTMETARAALAADFFDFIQFPYNMEHTEMKPTFLRAHKAGKKILVSRPFASGALFSGARSGRRARNSLGFILKEMKWGGAILVGTNNAEHLEENLKIFNELTTV